MTRAKGKQAGVIAADEGLIGIRRRRELHTRTWMVCSMEP